MKNKLMDLNDHLFAQIERLSDEDISTDGLAHEVDRTQAIATMASQIISNARLMLDAQKMVEDYRTKLAPVFETKCLTSIGPKKIEQN